MTVLVVYFLKAVKIQNDEAERLAVAACAIQFLFERFGEEPAIVKTGERIGDSVELQFFQVVVFDDNRRAKKSGGEKHIEEGGFQRDETAADSLNSRRRTSMSSQICTH